MKAKCINNYGIERYLTEGRTYTLLDFSEDYIRIQNDRLDVTWEKRSRFILVDE